MARGSGDSNTGSAAGGHLEMLPQSGLLENTGRYVIRRHYLVNDLSQLTTVPDAPQGFRPVSITYNRLVGENYEKIIEFQGSSYAALSRRGR